ncbi:DUF5696 domain-containing protein [Paenibacillus eucommiae]|uniref:Uncharacterized protein n=1 Tax=Paenibacillus eucommiae TaxID=1355755 RepID=A0ABS4IW54_9BACL|nr:DUF5696 domain-containing protein [Paenibacillus eucommiae]MBP1991804.1 hypothetical protein [Paenibacillus eucommiae]
MFSIRLKRKQGIVLILLLAAAACCLFVYRAASGSGMPSLKQMNMTMEQAPNMPVYEGEPWNPGSTDAEGFVTALENSNFVLRIDPLTTQTIVSIKRTGYEWRSNPPKQQLQAETVKGLLLSNLQSPFILEYFQASGDDKARRGITNAADIKLKKSFVKYDNDKGLQVTYFFEDTGIGFSLQYELTGYGLEVHVPTKGIEEKGEYALFSLEVLPYFGAAQAGEDGYLFVPDGPGGLIRFDADRSVTGQGYMHPIYGSEVSNVQPSLKGAARQTKRETIAYPVFGVKRQDEAYVAIVKEGEYAANIQALPPGLKSTLYSVDAKFQYREEYLHKMSRLTTPVKTVEKDRVPLDRSIEYRFLNGDQANYVGMAQTYRQYLADSKRLPQQLQTTAHIPLQLSVIGGNAQEAFNSSRYVAATTFAQATEMVKQLKDSGVESMRIIYYGWQNGGDFDATKRFPIESKLGGQAAAKSFVDAMHEMNLQVMFEDNFVYVDERSSLSAKSNGIRGIDGTVFMDQNNEFILKPELTAGYAVQTIARLKDIGVDGIHYNWLGELIFRDYEPKPTERKQAADVYRQLLAYTREELGETGIYQGNDYLLGEAGYISHFTLDSSYDFMIDETVPFYPIVLHGFVPYASTPANFRNDYTAEFLKAIEYGAVPSFYVTYESSQVLKNTPSEYLYSSEFALWKERIVQEYRDFDKLSLLYNRRIVNHEKKSDGIYVTTYEGGTQVIVDYGKKTFAVTGGGAE